MDNRQEEYSGRRVAISGPGGSGKTTLMTHMSRIMGFKELQFDTQSVMPQGIKSHLDVIRMSVENSQKGINFQENLVTGRYNLFKNYEGGFVSDRGVVDSYVYYSIHNSMFDGPDFIDLMRKTALDSFKLVDLTIVLAPRFMSPIANNVRVQNKSYYECLGGVFRDSVTDMFCESGIAEATGVEIPHSPIFIKLYRTHDTALAIFEEHGFSSVEHRMEAVRVSLRALDRLKGQSIELANNNKRMMN